jgi:four helix bundle protein
MPAITRFEDILAWQKARLLVREVYMTCDGTRLGKDYPLRDQLCSAAISSMSNTAEGFSRRNDKEFARFLDIARGSAAEVQSLPYVALDVGYVLQPEFDRLYGLAAETASLITGLTTYLRGGNR